MISVVHQRISPSQYELLVTVALTLFIIGVVLVIIAGIVYIFKKLASRRAHAYDIKESGSEPLIAPTDLRASLRNIVRMYADSGNVKSAISRAYLEFRFMLVKLLKVNYPEYLTEKEILKNILNKLTSSIYSKSSSDLEILNNLRHAYEIYERVRFGANKVDIKALEEYINQLTNIYEDIFKRLSEKREEFVSWIRDQEASRRD